MTKIHRSDKRLSHINELKSFLSEWRTTKECHDRLFELIGTKGLCSDRELAGSLQGDPRIEKDYVYQTTKALWRWKDGR